MISRSCAKFLIRARFGFARRTFYHTNARFRDLNRSSQKDPKNAQIQKIDFERPVFGNNVLLKSMTSNVWNREPDRRTMVRESRPESNAQIIINALLDRNPDYDRVRQLVSSGADIDGHDTNENTPLTEAARQGNNTVIRFLVCEMNASLRATWDCKDNMTPLHYAAKSRHESTIKLLCELARKFGDDRYVNVLDGKRRTAWDLSTGSTRQLIESLGGLSSTQVIKREIEKITFFMKR